MSAYATRLESGPWFSVGAQLDGATADRRVRDIHRQDIEARRPYCVYVHVPFCTAICRFCALYTFGVPARAHGVFDTYVDLVRRSIEQHPWAGSSRAPTTVHFGGGTPLCLGVERFAALVEALRGAFGNSPDCEWAVETTTSSVDETTVDALADLGFRRIHIGIQTLHDATRRRLGRHETGDQAIERLRELIARGFLVSVDLIIGFDGVGVRVVEDDLRRLYDAGVRIFSICELRERGGARRVDRDRHAQARHNYMLWLTIWNEMAAMGLAPIHAGQFARRQADNLYYTHPARAEDCVAIGPYAHGSAADVYYGNRLLPDYYDAIRAGTAPMAMGTDYSAGERVIRSLERELLAHEVSRLTLERVSDTFAAFAPIRDDWVTRGLLHDNPGRTTLGLSVEGSWFVGNMIEDARGLAGVTCAT